MSPTLDGICTVSQNVPSGLTVSILDNGLGWQRSCNSPSAPYTGPHGNRCLHGGQWRRQEFISQHQVNTQLICSPASGSRGPVPPHPSIRQDHMVKSWGTVATWSHQKPSAGPNTPGPKLESNSAENPTTIPARVRKLCGPSTMVLDTWDTKDITSWGHCLIEISLEVTWSPTGANGNLMHQSETGASLPWDFNTQLSCVHDTGSEAPLKEIQKLLSLTKRLLLLWNTVWKLHLKMSQFLWHEWYLSTDH